jgi:cystathionine beta-lyase/cystathionine gamma-synthase
LRQKRPNEEPGLIYSRINNPDLEMLEDRLAIWDQAEASLVFASGMAAISTTLWAYARPGPVIVHSGPVYGGTEFLLKKILPQFGVTTVGSGHAAAAALQIGCAWTVIDVPGVGHDGERMSAAAAVVSAAMHASSS